MTKEQRICVSGFGDYVATIALALAVAGCAAQPPPQSTYSSGPQRVLGYVSHAEAAECDMQGQMAGANAGREGEATYDEVRKTCLLSKAYASASAWAGGRTNEISTSAIVSSSRAYMLWMGLPDCSLLWRRPAAVKEIANRPASQQVPRTELRHMGFQDRFPCRVEKQQRVCAGRCRLL